MKSEHIIPFINATIETFDTMCGMTAKRNGKITVQQGTLPTYDVIATMGLSGTVKGAVMVTMSVEVACKTVGEFIGEEITEVCADLTDGIGEILNIVAGAAAAKLPDLKIKISLPTVLIGEHPMLAGNHEIPWISVPMCFPNGDKFNIKISMEEL